MDLTQIKNKSYISKLCIKFSKGYKSYTIIQLSTSTLTLVALTLPYILHTCGMVLGAVIFTIVSVVSFYTMTLMLEMIMKTNAISYYHFINYNRFFISSNNGGDIRSSSIFFFGKAVRFH